MTGQIRNLQKLGLKNFRKELHLENTCSGCDRASCYKKIAGFGGGFLKGKPVSVVRQ